MLRRQDGPQRDRTRLTSALVAFGVTLVLAIVAFAVWTHVHGPIDEASLIRSVARESGSPARLADLYGCSERKVGIWQCKVLERSASGTVTYNVTVSDGSCWNGTLADTRSGLSPPPPRTMPRTISGCTLLRD